MSSIRESGSRFNTADEPIGLRVFFCATRHSIILPALLVNDFITESDPFRPQSEPEMVINHSILKNLMTAGSSTSYRSGEQNHFDCD